MTFPDYKGAEAYPAPGNGFYASDRENTEIDRIILHVMVGSYEGSINWARTNPNRTSFHYAVARDARIGQVVAEKWAAHHAGNWPVNLRSIGVEHEDLQSWETPGWWTEAQMEASAKLVAHLLVKYDLKPTRQFVLGHYEVASDGRPCPGPHFPWGPYMAKVRRHFGVGGGKPGGNTSAGGVPDHLFETNYGVTEDEALSYVLGRGAHPDRAEKAIESIFSVPDQETAWRPAVRAAQSFLETGGWNYGHDSRPWNMAGIKKGGIVGDEPRDFEVPATAEAGAHMQANHGRAYSLREAVAPVHPRYRDALAAQKSRGGPITRVSQLGGGIWATDPDYAEKLLAVIAGMRGSDPNEAVPRPTPNPRPETLTERVDRSVARVLTYEGKPYEFWKVAMGLIPSRDPAHAVNAPPPSPAQVRSMFCVAVCTMMLRELGIPIPNPFNDPDWDGGVLAYWTKYVERRKVSRPYDPAMAMRYPKGTLLLAPYVNEARQGDGAVCLGGGRTISSNAVDNGSTRPGVGRKWTIAQLHSFFGYRAVVLPGPWLGEGAA